MFYQAFNGANVYIVKGVMSRVMVDAFSELCFPFLKGGNSTFIAVITSDHFPKNEYWSLE